VIGKPGEGHHITHPDFRYRSLGGNEISSIRQTGFVHPNPMGSKGGRKNVKHWTQGDGRQFYRPDQEVIRVHNSNMTPNEPVQAQHIELWHKPTNTFKPINDKYLNEQVFHKTQAAASIIVNKQGKFLVIRREPNDTSGGHWETPKGGVDPGEIPEQAVVRETKEEVGLDIQVIKLAKKISFYHPFKKRDVEFLIYFCKMTDPMQSVKLSHEHDAFKWVDINTFKKLMNWGDLGKNYINAANDISRDHRLRKMMTEGRMYKTYIVRIRSED
jgi:8-oxo-dGTP diphosphatase